jgi:hypothetical protein
VAAPLDEQERSVRRRKVFIMINERTLLTIVLLTGTLVTHASVLVSFGRDLPKEWLRCEQERDCTYVTVRGCGGSSPVNKKYEQDARQTFRLKASQSDCYEPPKPLQDFKPKVGCINNLCSGTKNGQ